VEPADFLGRQNFARRHMPVVVNQHKVAGRRRTGFAAELGPPNLKQQSNYGKRLHPAGLAENILDKFGS